MFDSRFYIYFEASPFILLSPVPTCVGMIECGGADLHSVHKSVTASCSITHGPQETSWWHTVLGPQDQLLRDEFQREEMTAGQIQYVHRRERFYI